MLTPAIARCRSNLQIFQGSEIDDLSRGKIAASVAELAEERDAVSGLDLI